jgi:uroporphyrinogen-III synthase
MRILVTRPEPDGERTASALRERGHDVTVMPLMTAEPVDAAIGNGPWGGVIATSANACRALASRPDLAGLVDLPFFAVGRRTAQAARAAGFCDVTAAEGDAKALAAAILESASREQPLLYLAGEERAADLEGMLEAAGFSVTTAVVYRMVAMNGFSAAVAVALAGGEIDAALHYSAASAGACLAAGRVAGVEPSLLKIRHFCLSAQVAAALESAGANDLRIAAQPSETALFDLIGSA